MSRKNRAEGGLVEKGGQGMENFAMFRTKGGHNDRQAGRPGQKNLVVQL